MKRKALWFLVWLVFILLLYRLPARSTASQGYPPPSWPYPGPGEIYLPAVQQAAEPTDSALPPLTP